MGSDVSIIFTIAGIIFISPYLSTILRIPTTPIEIILGSIGGYYALITNNHILEILAEVGFFYLMFLAGTEVNFNTLLKMDRTVLKKSLLYLFFLYSFSSIFSWAFSFNIIYVVILPLISVGLILTLYKEFDKNTRWLNLSMQAGILGELISIVAITITGAMVVHGVGEEFYTSMIYLVVFLVLMLILFHFFKLLFWWFPEIKTFLIPLYSDRDEKDIRLSMALFFLMMGVMVVFGLEIAFGAFIAGMFIATFFEHQKELPHKLSSFGFGFLIPIFFVYIGSSFDLRSLSTDGLIMSALMITFSMIAIRVSASFAFIGYLSFNERILFALSHSMPLTLLVAVATLAYQNNSIDQLSYRSFILAGLFEVLVCIIAIKFISKLSK